MPEDAPRKFVPVNPWKGSVDRVTMAFFAVVLVAIVALVARNFSPEPYAPLGNYAIQQVGYKGFLTDRDGNAVDPPPQQVLPTTTYAGDLDPIPMLVVENGLETLPVHAEKCLDSDVPVQVVGQVRWRNIDPVGATIQGSKGTVTRQPNCQTFDYNYTIPLEMLQRLQLLAAEGIRESKWLVQGDEVPTEPKDASLPVTKYWESTEFVVKYIGPEALQNTTSTLPAPIVPVNPFPDVE